MTGRKSKKIWARLHRSCKSQPMGQICYRESCDQSTEELPSSGPEQCPAYNCVYWKKKTSKSQIVWCLKFKSGYQNRIETLFDMLMFDNYKNSLNNMAIRINLKKDLGMILRHAETQATTSEETQAMMNRVSQVTTYGVLPMNDGHWYFQELTMLKF